jgi:hypothetical protein
MNIRSTSRTVTFQYAFTLPGMAQPHPPGTFEVIVDEEKLDVSWDAYRTSSRIMLSSPGGVAAHSVTTDDLEAALMRDRSSRESSSFS